MPELPDVEVFRKYFNSTSLHQEIREVKVLNRRMLKGISAPKLKSTLGGQSFRSTARHGKYLFAELKNGSWLVLHFGMTGFLKYFRHTDKEPPHDRLLLTFSNGYHLAYDCQRKLGEIGLVDDKERFVRERDLGPDALAPDFNLAAFKETFSRAKRSSVKSAFMNQKLTAGIGNVYSDEILFQTKIHPRTKVKNLAEKQLEKLFREMKKVLQTAIQCQATPERFPGSYIIPHRRRNGKCPRCSRQLERKKISGRSAYYCPRCQRDERK
jgi:formamidopyrimidine-DNA glycosylase